MADLTREQVDLSMAKVDEVRALLEEFTPDRSMRWQILLASLADIVVEDTSDDHVAWSAHNLMIMDTVMRLAILSMALHRRTGE
jgi:hypothetical protein